MMKLLIPFVLLLSSVLVACMPVDPLIKNASISVTAGSATYSLNEYCTQFSQADRRMLRQQIALMSVHKAEVTCLGDEE